MNIYNTMRNPRVSLELGLQFECDACRVTLSQVKTEDKKTLNQAFSILEKIEYAVHEPARCKKISIITGVTALILLVSSVAILILSSLIPVVGIAVAIAKLAAVALLITSIVKGIQACKFKGREYFYTFLEKKLEPIFDENNNALDKVMRHNRGLLEVERDKLLLTREYRVLSGKV